MESYTTPMPPKPKHVKEWTIAELRELVALAGSKRINQKWLAEHWIGIHPVTFSYWLSEKSEKSPPTWARLLLTYMESHIRKLPSDQ